MRACARPSISLKTYIASRWPSRAIPGRSLSQAVAELLRRGLSASPDLREAGPSGFAIDASTGLPRVRSRRLITAEDVRGLDDEA